MTVGTVHERCLRSFKAPSDDDDRRSCDDRFFFLFRAVDESVVVVTIELVSSVSVSSSSL